MNSGYMAKPVMKRLGLISPPGEMKIRPAVFVLMALILLGFYGCSSSSDKKERRDFDKIESSGYLKVIVRPRPISLALPGITQILIDRKLALALSRKLGLKLKLVVMDDEAAMVRKLRDGKADFIAAGIIASPEKDLAFSIPYRYTDELLIVKKEVSPPPGRKAGEDSLKGRTVCLSRANQKTSAVKMLKSMGVKKFIKPLPGADPDQALALVERDECYGAVVDSVSWDEFSDKYTALTQRKVLEKSLPIALLMRPGAVQLRRRINEFLISRSLTSGSALKYKFDLEGIKKKKVLRMITRNNALTYYIYRGTPVGFDYELMKKFADTEGLRLEVVLPPGHSDLIPWLNEGRADVVAAAMTMTGEREKKAAFTMPYNYVKEVVIVRKDDKSIKSPLDFVGKTVHVRKSSSFYGSLMALKKKGLDFEIVQLPDDMETEDIIDGLIEKRWDITVCDSNLLAMERDKGKDVKVAFTIKKQGIGWAVRKEDVQLLSALNAFIKKNYRGFFYNTLKDKYFKNSVSSGAWSEKFRYDRSGHISPYDEMAKKYAGRYGLDWRLIVAQIFQESGFNPRKVSWAGARGLMQVMPRTARELGLKDLYDPESSIKAGTYYLKKLLDRFAPSIKLKDRIRFALAAYHVGYNHVADARLLARRQGLNPDVWFDNVEKAMLLLQKRVYYRKTRYGYCNGRRTVNYVREILNRYNTYLRADVNKAA